MAWRQAIIWTNDGLVYLRIYASLILNELNPYKTPQISLSWGSGEEFIIRIL